MAKISATILTYNEEENIRSCLETVEWCDEIIVIDGYSDDRTVEIAREHADRIIQREGEGYSEPFRKLAVEEASGDWILMVDADERVRKPLADKLREKAGDDSLDVVKAPRKNHMFGEWLKFGQWWPDFVPCLYRPEAVSISEEIHSFLEIKDDAEVRKLPADSKTAIEHYSYTDLEDRIERINRYTSIEAEEAELSMVKMLSAAPRKFAKDFLLGGGVKYGRKGFLICLVDSFYPLMTQLKRWQLSKLGSRKDFEQSYRKKDKHLLEEFDPR